MGKTLAFFLIRDFIPRFAVTGVASRERRIASCRRNVSWRVQRDVNHGSFWKILWTVVVADSSQRDRVITGALD
jgi:hypothetical protein